MSSYLNRLLERLVIVEQQSIASISPKADAKPFFIYHQEAFPYFTNRIADDAPDEESAHDLQMRLYTVYARLVVAHLGTKYQGESEKLLYELIPLIEDALSNDQWLLGEDDNEDVTELSAIGVEYVRSRGLVVFQNAGIPVQQVGTEFILNVSFAIDLYRRY